MTQAWVNAVAVQRLHQGRPVVFRHNGRQIVIFLTEHGVRACNNRCPHEGYPLSEGSLNSTCILTCNWHNWKFDLHDGANLYGGDRLRVYATEIRDGDVWIDLADPPVDVRRQLYFDNLRDAFDDHEYDRIARELGRLLLLETDGCEILSHAIDWCYDRLEFGWGHAFAGCADWLTLYRERPDDEEHKLICLLESIGHMADDVLRERTYPYAEHSLVYDEDGFVTAIEDEDEATAIAYVRGVFEAGLAFEDMEHGLTRAALAHYNDFGHSLIYVYKARRLSEHLSADTMLKLLLCLVRSLIYANRDDQIPEFREYARALQQWCTDSDVEAPESGAYWKLSIDKALALTAGSGAAAPEQYKSLLLANANNLLGYDTHFQTQVNRPVSDNVGWLDFTHGLTFANAVRNQCSRYPELWPQGLLQLACFIGRNSAYIVAEPDLARWHVDNAAVFFTSALDTLFDHGRDEYIVSVHILKTLCAVREEYHWVGNTQHSSVLLAAMNRFLHEPLKRKHVRRTVRQALNFVARDI